MKTLKFTSLLVIVLLGWPQIAFPQPDFTAQIEDIVERYSSERNFHGSLLVANSDGILYQSSRGAANYEWGIPNSADTKFRLGSLTKAFTSVLVFQLVQEGTLSLDGTISDYLPLYREDTGEQVTIHHLLNHTSGIPDIPEEIEDEIVRDYFSVNDFLTEFGSGDLQSPPGSDYSYSNVGYFILGAILEEVSGMSYGELINSKIFEPLDMNDSGLDLHSTILDKRASGYELVEDELRNAHYIDMAMFLSFGGLYSTVEDLYKWERSLHTEELISNQMKQIMYTHRNNRPTGYANGWFLNSEDTDAGIMNLIGVGGSISGFSTTIQRIVETKDVVIVLNNVWRIGETYMMAAEILEALQRK
ncbi:MAG: beta-lactamase family protein [Pseudomonadales bacterium]|nr:beta-lactamase family protein [Pseudomonadales bacterium]